MTRATQQSNGSKVFLEKRFQFLYIQLSIFIMYRVQTQRLRQTPATLHQHNFSLYFQHPEFLPIPAAFKESKG